MPELSSAFIKVQTFVKNLPHETSVMLCACTAACVPGEYPLVKLVPCAETWTHVAIGNRKGTVNVISYNDSLSEICANHDVASNDFYEYFWPTIIETWEDWLRIEEFEFWTNSLKTWGIDFDGMYPLYKPTNLPLNRGLTRNERLIQTATTLGQEYAYQKTDRAAFVTITTVADHVQWVIVGFSVIVVLGLTAIMSADASDMMRLTFSMRTKPELDRTLRFVGAVLDMVWLEFNS